MPPRLRSQGGELFQYIIDHWPLSEETVRRFFQQIICAVEHIHYFRCRQCFTMMGGLSPGRAMLAGEGGTISAFSPRFSAVFPHFFF